ncbi:N-acetylated-alpha-linked acidic dipeptidase-like protein [Tetranychus urticae]|uniref:Peptidase M28 domain-containing protein n=1 Tax=Tetranychus urticae TaxID=32264 RepID=T1KPU3_TETUR|nr:N-acetylated-alpha-linked acidic dipeptidase-like protein [Tetranychus urticae]
MAAAYRPYKDEDSFDNLNALDDDGLNWPDNEPASLQIYERTTEDLPFPSNRRYLIACLGLAIMSMFIGLMIGYFAHSSHDECIPNYVVSLHSVRQEDPTISSKLLNSIDVANLESLVREFSKEPRVPGSARDQYLVSFIQKYFLDASFDKVSILNYTALLSLPDEINPNLIQIINEDTKQVVFNSSEGLKLDPKQIHPFSAYSPNIDLQGDLVYVNNGHPDDYRLLVDKYSIDFKGKIILVKLGELPLDQVVHTAKFHAVAAIIFFPDHKFFEVNHSAFKFPSDAIKWESALWAEFGDPLSPNYPSTAYAYRENLGSHKNTLAKISAQPISSDQAMRLIHLLGGHKSPPEWNSGSNFSHAIGPGFNNSNLKIRIKVNNHLKNETISNVFGYIKGRVEPDRYILIGSHRDSLTKGAMDAASGTGVMLEVARAFGELLKKGWRPRRTIIFCSWGAEEFNLQGSTEWLEDKYKLLHARGIVYINADTVVSGNDSLRVFASPLLHHAILNATKMVSNPDKDDSQHKTVFEKWFATFPYVRNDTIVKQSGFIQKNSYEMDLFYGDQDIFADLLTKEETLAHLNHVNSTYLISYIEGVISHRQPQILPIQGRSVYAAFTTFLGIPSMDLSYVSSNQNSEAKSLSAYSLIHTQYDTFDLFKTSIDPDFKYHKAMAQIYAEVLRDFSESLFIPFNLFHYVQFLQNVQLKIYYQAQHLFPKGGLDTDVLSSAIHNFTDSVYNFHLRQGSIDFSDPMAIRTINDQLILLERVFLDPVQLYMVNNIHLIQNPEGLYSGENETLVGLINSLYQIFSNPHNLDAEGNNLPTILERGLKPRLSILVHAIQNAADIINSVV